jgi:pyruvate kinase
MRRTKIVATLGPASENRDVISAMIRSGMDVARLNMSHGDHDFHERIFRSVRSISDTIGRDVAIMFDIQGPKIRVGPMGSPLSVKAGEMIRVLPGSGTGTGDTIYIDHERLLDDLTDGDEIFINDGTIRLTVMEKDGTSLNCRVENAGIISSHKGCNLPTSKLSLKVPTEKDEIDLDFISKMDPEFVAISFVNEAKDVERIRRFLDERGANDVKLVSKIERPSALADIDHIIAVSDAVMVARGDLGVEIPLDRVPAAQKEIIRKCNRAGKPVIVATQMLESMMTNPRPTRAEANDVFNAVLDGADAMMLSAETSTGQYPIDSVRFMDRIASTAESNMPMRDPDYYDSEKGSVTEAAGHACFTLACELKEMGKEGAIIAITRSGFSARMISKYRPCLPILAMSPDRRTCRELNLVWGVRPVHSPEMEGEDLESRAVRAIGSALDLGFVRKDDCAILAFTSSKSMDSGIYTAVYDLSVLDSKP